MPEKVKEYESDELSVIWKPESCIHSENCWKGLSSVFNPKERPWIQVGGAEDQQIRAQIDQCPSGALSYKLKAETSKRAEVVDEQMVEVTKDGPLMVYGNIKVKGHDGTETSKHRVTAFCRCGASQNKPFCDGSHKKVDFKG